MLQRRSLLAGHRRRTSSSWQPSSIFIRRFTSSIIPSLIFLLIIFLHHSQALTCTSDAPPSSKHHLSVRLYNQTIASPSTTATITTTTTTSETISLPNNVPLNDDVNNGVIKSYQSNFDISKQDAIYLKFSPCMRHLTTESMITVMVSLSSDMTNSLVLTTGSLPIQSTISKQLKFSQPQNPIYIQVKSNQYQTYQITLSKSNKVYPEQLSLSNSKMGLSLFKKTIDDPVIKYRYGVQLQWYPPSSTAISNYQYKIYYTICNLYTVCGMLSADNVCGLLSSNQFYAYHLYESFDYYNQTFFLPSNFDEKEIQHLEINVLVIDGTNPTVYGLYTPILYSSGGMTNLVIFLVLIVIIPLIIMVIFMVLLSIYLYRRRKKMGKYSNLDQQLSTNNQQKYQYDVFY